MAPHAAFDAEHACAQSPTIEAIVRHLGHQVRNPLNAILGYVELLQMTCQREGVPERFQHYAHHISLGSQELLAEVEAALAVAAKVLPKPQVTNADQADLFGQAP